MSSLDQPVYDKLPELMTLKDGEVGVDMTVGVEDAIVGGRVSKFLTFFDD
jgi:hypothetical protein